MSPDQKEPLEHNSATSDLKFSPLHKAYLKVIEKVLELHPADTPSLSLSFAGKTFSPEAVCAVVQASLVKQENMAYRLKFNVSELDFSGCKFMYKDRQTLQDASTLKKSGSGHKVDAMVDEKAMASRSQALVLTALCDLLKASKTLVTLNLSKNSLGTSFVVQMLTSGVAWSQSLKNLILQSVIIEGESIPDELCLILMTSQDYIRHVGPMKDIDGSRCTSLRHLDLSRNTLSSESLKKMVILPTLARHITSIRLCATVAEDNKMTCNNQTLEQILSANSTVMTIMDEIISEIFKRQFRTKLNTFRADVKTFRSKNSGAIADSINGENTPAYKVIAASEQETRHDPFKPVVTPSAYWKGGFAMSVGRRSEMQDVIAMRGKVRSYDTEEGVEHHDDYWAVYDGHGGREAANYAAENLHALITHEIDAMDPAANPKEKSEGIERAFQKCSKQMASWCTITGTTVIAVYCHQKERYTINLGDSRAILFNSRAEVPLCLTRDHRPVDPEERKRIIAIPGGSVEDGRVNGKLSVSRSLGDSSLHPYVSSIPDVNFTPIDDDDQFMVLASDGLWDIFGGDGANVGERHSTLTTANMAKWNEGMKEVQRIVSSSPGPSEAARKLCELAFKRGSEDNISVIVIFFKMNILGSASSTGTVKTIGFIQLPALQMGSDAEFNVEKLHRGRPVANPLFKKGASLDRCKELLVVPRHKESVSSFMQPSPTASANVILDNANVPVAKENSLSVIVNAVLTLADEASIASMQTNNTSTVALKSIAASKITELSSSTNSHSIRPHGHAGQSSSSSMAPIKSSKSTVSVSTSNASQAISAQVSQNAVRNVNIADTDEVSFKLSNNNLDASLSSRRSSIPDKQDQTNMTRSIGSQIASGTGLEFTLSSSSSGMVSQSTSRVATSLDRNPKAQEYPIFGIPEAQTSIADEFTVEMMGLLNSMSSK